MTLTITSPSSYYLYDFQPITVDADEVKDYSFSWFFQMLAEVGLVPAELTAYDAAWLTVD